MVSWALFDQRYLSNFSSLFLNNLYPIQPKPHCLKNPDEDDKDVVSRFLENMEGKAGQSHGQQEGLAVTTWAFSVGSARESGRVTLTGTET